MVSTIKWLLGETIVAALMLGGATITAHEPATNQAKDKIKSGDIDYGPVQSAQALLGYAVHSASGKDVGQVDDLTLDLGKGALVGIRVKSSRPANENNSFVPLDRLQWSDQGPSITIAQDERPGKVADDQAQSQFTSFRALQGQAVYGPQGDKLGHLDDLALARQKGLIVYVVFVDESKSQASSSRYPIPLGAFVVPGGTSRWILELPEGLLASTSPMNKGEWPTSVSPAWHEYVAVRYGGSPLGGVERELRSQRR